MGILQGKTPDITPGQIASLLTFVIGQLVAWKWVSNDQAQTIIASGSIIVAAAWKIADAYLRGSRAKAALAPSPAPTPGPTA